MDGLQDLRVTWQIETEKGFGARAEVSPEISGRDKGRGGGAAAAAVLHLGRGRHVGGREQAVENVGSDVGECARRRAAERGVGGMLEAAGDDFTWGETGG